MIIDGADQGAETSGADAPGMPEIQIAIDAQGISRACLEVAMMVAEQTKAGLLGLFVEDLLLQSVAELPFTTEVVRSTGEERDLLADRLRLRHLQLLDRMRALFDECALSREVSFRFEVSERKLPVIRAQERVSGIYVPGRRRGDERKSLPGTALRRIKVLYDGSEQARRALDMVSSLVAAGRCQEVVVVNLRSLPASLLAELSERGARVYLLNEAESQQAVLRQIADGPADLVLVPMALAERVGEAILQGSLEHSASGGTLLVA